MPNSLPIDYGPIYAETVMGRFPVEPWNTMSNLIFLVIVIVYAYRIKLNLRHFKFMTVCLFVLFVGFLGGTVYHATRSSNLWLFIDCVSIFVLALMVSVYLWIDIVKRAIWALLINLSALSFMTFLRDLNELPRHLTVSLGYVSLVLVLMLPAVVVCIRDRFRNWLLLAIALIAISIAILFRILDSSIQFTNHGTHFLWHLFGGLAAFSLTEYIYRKEMLRAPLSKKLT